MIVCKTCGTKSDEKDIFCQGCGKELKWSKISDIKYSDQFNPNLLSTTANPRSLREIVSVRNREDLILLISLVLNVLTPLLFYDFNSQLFTSANNVFILTMVVVFLLLSISEPKNLAIRGIMILINFYYFEFALFTANIVLLLIAVYQLSIKGFNSQLYSNYSYLHKVDTNQNLLKIALFLIYFSIPRILQGPGPNQPGWSINYVAYGISDFFTSPESLIYFFWICLFAFIFFLIIINKPWEKLAFFRKIHS